MSRQVTMPPGFGVPCSLIAPCWVGWTPPCEVDSVFASSFELLLHAASHAALNPAAPTPSTRRRLARPPVSDCQALFLPVIRFPHSLPTVLGIGPPAPSDGNHSPVVKQSRHTATRFDTPPPHRCRRHGRLVPNWRSPASPRPGTMKACSLRQSSIAAM